MNHAPAGRQRVVAVFERATEIDPALPVFEALSRALSLELAALFVENVDALAAAALPFTRALAAAATAWEPLDPAAVASALSADAARLRARLAAFASSRDLPWVLHVRRGRRGAALGEFADQAAWIFYPAQPPAPPARATVRAHRRIVAAIYDGSPAGERVLETARRLAAALDAVLRIWIAAGSQARFDALRGAAQRQLAAAVRPAEVLRFTAWTPGGPSGAGVDLLVAPRGGGATAGFEASAVPVLLVV